MDSNVSKNTFSHKFFKLGFTPANSFISIRYLLEQKLLSTLDLYRQKMVLPLNEGVVANIERQKIAILKSSLGSISSSRQNHKVLLTSQLTPIIYSSSIALFLASQCKKTPQIVAAELLELLFFEFNNNTCCQFNLNFQIEIGEGGWINFYLDAKSLAKWLDLSWILLGQPNITSYNQTSLQPLAQTPGNLFAPQYVHARCCSLLRLAMRAKLISLEESEGRWIAPESISWLDMHNSLWWSREWEFSLIGQLLIVVDSFAVESTDEERLAIKLSEKTAIFLGESRFMGEMQHETPEKAIACLGLIAIAQYWLRRVLVEKLGVVAPTSL